MKKLFTILALMLPSLGFAQWRVGVNGGADNNHFIIDKHYQTDYVYDDRWGVTLGVMGQYDINDWLGIRAELDWTQKNYRHHRQVNQLMDYKYVNNYLQLPVMASFSFGGQKLRGFCNAGIYGGYWLTSGREGFGSTRLPKGSMSSARTSVSTASATSASTSAFWAVSVLSTGSPSTGLLRSSCATTTVA